MTPTEIRRGRINPLFRYVLWAGRLDGIYGHTESTIGAGVASLETCVQSAIPVKAAVATALRGIYATVQAHADVRHIQAALKVYCLGWTDRYGNPLTSDFPLGVVEWDGEVIEDIRRYRNEDVFATAPTYQSRWVKAIKTSPYYRLVLAR